LCTLRVEHHSLSGNEFLSGTSLTDLFIQTQQFHSDVQEVCLV